MILCVKKNVNEEMKWKVLFLNWTEWKGQNNECHLCLTSIFTAHVIDFEKKWLLGPVVKDTFYPSINCDINELKWSSIVEHPVALFLE